MKNLIIIIIIIVSFCFSNLSYSQNNELTQTKLEYSIFVGLEEVKCEGVGAMHKYINSLKAFKMIPDKREYFTTYKLKNNNNNYNLFFSIYDVKGFRIDTPNSYLQDARIEQGSFKETHKEGATSFLVYTFSGEDFILGYYVEKGKNHYYIDTYCYD